MGWEERKHEGRSLVYDYVLVLGLGRGKMNIHFIVDLLIVHEYFHPPFCGYATFHNSQKLIVKLKSALEGIKSKRNIWKIIEMMGKECLIQLPRMQRKKLCSSK